jgi:hypothetical protein
VPTASPQEQAETPTLCGRPPNGTLFVLTLSHPSPLVETTAVSFAVQLLGVTVIYFCPDEPLSTELNVPINTFPEAVDDDETAPP